MTIKGTKASAKLPAGLSGKKVEYVIAKDVGLKNGPNSEFTLMFNVKPGHAEQLHKDLQWFGQQVDNSDVPFKVGLHESRLSIFDDGTRLLFATTFDGDINLYVDDAIFLLGTILHPWLRHLEGYPGTMDAYPTTDIPGFKKWFMSHFRTSSVYTRLYPRTLGEVIKALRVNDAFQKVLDDPKSHRLLEDPALKPLLDLASE